MGGGKFVIIKYKLFAKIRAHMSQPEEWKSYLNEDNTEFDGVVKNRLQNRDSKSGERSKLNSEINNSFRNNILKQF